MPADSARIVRGPGGCTKVCQLTGDLDRERLAPVINQTLGRAGIFGTDLGASFAHAGKRWLLFGDTVGAVMDDRDAVAWTNDTDPDDCLALDFPTDEGSQWLPPIVPGISQGAFEVPMAGVSAAGAMYVFFTTDHTQAVAMGRSVLARSDDGLAYTLVGDVSREKFINVSPVVVECGAWPGLPQGTGECLLLFGSGEYRRSTVALAVAPLAQIEDAGARRFLTGITDGAPQWSEHEADAMALTDEACVGELSVSWNPQLAAWLMTYNCDDPPGSIRFLTAATPWGPWSEPQALFDPWSDSGYCHFIHVSHQDQVCDQVHDPGRENEYGGAYGPYQIPPFSRPSSGGNEIFFTLSTWNPYAVVLMRAELARE